MHVSLKDRDIKEFDPLFNLNPDFFRIQRTQASTGYNKASFLAQRPQPDALLYSYAFIRWTWQTTRTRLPNNAENFAVNNLDAIFTKPYGMSNSMTEISVRYNGHLTSYKNPRFWAKYVHAAESTRDLMRHKFSPAGGPFPDYLGVYNVNGRLDGATDGGINQGFDNAFENYRDQVNVGSTATFTFEEPLMVGLHSPYELKHKLQPKSRYKRISWMIPHIRQFGLEVKFDKIPANSLVFMYGRKSANAGQLELIDTPEVQNLTGELILYWINPSAGYKIPREVVLPSWYLEHFQFKLVGPAGAVLIRDGQESVIDTGQMTLHQVPNAILIYAGSTKTGPNYNCRALNADSDGGGADIARGILDGSEELNLGINAMNIRININNVTVDNDFSRKQLYRITEKNCNEIPFGFTSWDGGSRKLGNTPGASFLYLWAEDLNIKRSTGVQVFNFNVQIVATFVGREGYSFSVANPFNGQANPEHEYDLHVVFFFDNYRYILREDGFVTSEFLTHTL